MSKPLRVEKKVKSGERLEMRAHEDENTIFYPLSPMNMSLYYSFLPEIEIE